MRVFIHFSYLLDTRLTLWVALVFKRWRLRPPLQRKVGYLSSTLSQLDAAPTKQNPLELDNMNPKLDVMLQSDILLYIHEHKPKHSWRLCSTHSIRHDLYSPHRDIPPAARCPPSVHTVPLVNHFSHGSQRSLFGFLRLLWYHQPDWLFRVLVRQGDLKMGRRRGRACWEMTKMVSHTSKSLLMRLLILNNDVSFIVNVL